MKEIILFFLICSYALSRGTPQRVVSLVAITLTTGFVTLFHSRSIWPGSLFLVGIVGGLVVLIRFTFIIFPKERFKERKKLLELRESFLLPFLLVLLCFLTQINSDPFFCPISLNVQIMRWRERRVSSFGEIREPFRGSSPLLLGFIFLFLFVILFRVEAITKLIA